MQCQNIKHICLYTQLLNTICVSIRTVPGYNIKIIDLNSKHFKHNQVCFSFGRMKMFIGPIVNLI